MRFLREQIALLEDCRARFGDAFTLRIANLGRFVVLGEPEVVRQALVLGADTAHAGEARAVLEPLVGMSSMLLLDEEQHLHQRRLMAAPFKGERLAVYPRPDRPRGRRVAAARGVRAATLAFERILRHPHVHHRLLEEVRSGETEYAPAAGPPEGRRRRAVSLAPAQDARVVMTARRPAASREVAHA